MGSGHRLECSSCGAVYAGGPLGTCASCGKTLLARYDLASVRREGLLPRSDLWRYLPLLPIPSEDGILSLGEGGTPLLRCRNLEATFGVERAYVKDEARNPTGTFKARGMAVAVAMARHLGLRTLAVASAGNAGAALAAYAAKASLPCVVVMPKDAPLPVVQETVGFGAYVARVDGTIAKAGEIVREYCAATGAFDLATLQEPYRVEGKKTMGLELWEQLGSVPDWILFPTGGGTGIVGLWKAFRELRELGWTDEGIPKLAAVQAATCAPIVRAFTAGRDTSDAWPEPRTIAAGLRVPKPFADTLILRALRETNGTAIAVPDEEMRSAAVELAHMEGIHACYEGAATLGALKAMRRRGAIHADETVVLFNTGTGFVNPEPPRTLKIATVGSAEDLIGSTKRTR